MTLDHRLIVRRRHAMGLTTSALARKIGIRATSLRSLEQGGDRGASLSLLVLNKLARTLEISPRDLFQSGYADDPSPAEAETSGQAADPRPVTRAIAAMLQAGQAVPAADLAQLCGVTTRALRGELAVYEPFLAECGLRLHRTAGTGLSLRPMELLTEDQEQFLERARLRRSGLSNLQRTVLRSSLRAERSSGGNRSEFDRHVVAGFLRAGVMELADGVPELSAMARYNLGIADSSAPSSPR